LTEIQDAEPLSIEEAAQALLATRRALTRATQRAELAVATASSVEEAKQALADQEAAETDHLAAIEALRTVLGRSPEEPKAPRRKARAVSVVEHGKPGSYNSGCRCDDCCDARSAYDRRRKAALEQPGRVTS
jgi:small-conductance mechanosensitive channel